MDGPEPACSCRAHGSGTTNVSVARSLTMWSERYTGFLELKERSILPPKNLPLGESSFTDKSTATGELTENCSSRSGLTNSL